jgi:colanic acid biosynthesis glycosyl transferase WcaI
MYFHPEPVGIAPMATDLAKYLAEAGWDVTVVAGMPKLPAWEPYEGFQGRWLMRNSTTAGAKIIRTWIYIPEKPKVGLMKAWRRVLFDTSIAVSGFPAALTQGRPDIILTLTPPLQLAAAAIALKKFWRCPIVNWIQDIVPDAALSVGMMKEGAMIRLARKLENFVYREVDHIAVISEGFIGNLEGKGVPSEKISVITNWADIRRFDEVTPTDRRAQRAALGVGEKDFVLMHAGSLAAKQVMENVVRAMKLMEDQRDVHVFFLGDGIRKRALQEEVARLSVPRITFLPTTTGDAFIHKLRAADLLIVNQSRELVDALVPSKLLTYLPAQKPVIAAVNKLSEAARFVEKSRCGLLVEPEVPEAFAKATFLLKNQPEECAEMGRRGDQFVRQNFAKPAVLKQFEDLLIRFAGPADRF